MNLTLHELMDAVTLEGSVFIRIWNDNIKDYVFNKNIDDLIDNDLWIYGYPVKYIYPVDGSVIIELYMEV